MTPSDQTKSHVIANYIEPARQRGEKTVLVRVGSVQKELGWNNRAPSVFSTLSSRPFQKEAGIELVEKRGGPPSGGPSTTVQYVFRLLDQSDLSLSGKGKAVSNGTGLDKLYGVLADTFRRLGGADAYIKAEREAWGPDAWEQRESENKPRTEKAE